MQKRRQRRPQSAIIIGSHCHNNAIKRRTNNNVKQKRRPSSSSCNRPNYMQDTLNSSMRRENNDVHVIRTRWKPTTIHDNDDNNNNNNVDISYKIESKRRRNGRRWQCTNTNTGLLRSLFSRINKRCIEEYGSCKYAFERFRSNNNGRISSIYKYVSNIESILCMKLSSDEVEVLVNSLSSSNERKTIDINRFYQGVILADRSNEEFQSFIDKEPLVYRVDELFHVDITLQPHISSKAREFIQQRASHHRRPRVKLYHHHHRRNGVDMRDIIENRFETPPSHHHHRHKQRQYTNRLRNIVKQRERLQQYATQQELNAICIEGKKLRQKQLQFDSYNKRIKSQKHNESYKITPRKEHFVYKYHHDHEPISMPNW